MKFTCLVTSLILGLIASNPVEASSISLFELHNPPGGNPNNIEGANAKSQFAMRNDSTDGVEIDSILWTFAAGVFIDSTAAAPGYGTFRNYLVSPAQTYEEITVLANSNTIVGYTGPTSFTNGATSLFLTFNDFAPGEAFGFWTDLDTTNNIKGHLGNSDFNGSTTTVVFSDGTQAVYDWVLPNNSGRSFSGSVTGECVYNCEEDPCEYGGCTTTTTPEPASMILFGTGLVGAAIRKRMIS